MIMLKKYKRMLVSIVALSLGLLFTPLIVAQVSSQHDLSWSVLLSGGSSKQSQTYQVQDALGTWQGGVSTSESTVVVAGFVQSFGSVPQQPPIDDYTVYMPVIIR